MKAAAAQKLTAFLRKYCSDPPALLSEMLKQPGRTVTISDGRALCRKGDVADDIWVILEGAVRVHDDGLITTRTAGDLVGEAAFYRLSPAQRMRGADMFASGDARLFRIDLSFVDSLSERQAGLWHEVVARVLTEKLDESQRQRSALRLKREEQERLLNMFVCEEGHAAAMANFSDQSSDAIDPEACDVLTWFSDIVGFSCYAASVSPIEAAGVVREIMDLQARLIGEAGGQIDKFIGDGLMAFWRVPDAARRKRHFPAAAHAALTVCSVLADMARERALELDIRIGLHSGPAILGDFGGGGRIAFTSIGESVNTASRLEQARFCMSGEKLGPVRLSDVVYGHLAGHAVADKFEPAGRIVSDKNDIRYTVHCSLP
ncbi:adenylate/guanylate cyclase domain-containing protein [Rhizobium leguminosarum]|uniref:Adenylate/guanylate cyclase n=1 Tax=Rhizobium leguminosarum TaxID=384 RepID=A0A2K9ZG89_RHILE|nr:adenylate/guanylate cyclase domain-containing protein [Rhizobium leguminosarum]AUW47273.1 Adenylate/guanylate cyclase [Rhizobium leguminosarum]